MKVEIKGLLSKQKLKQINPDNPGVDKDNTISFLGGKTISLAANGHKIVVISDKTDPESAAKVILLNGVEPVHIETIGEVTPKQFQVPPTFAHQLKGPLAVLQLKHPGVGQLTISIKNEKT